MKTPTEMIIHDTKSEVSSVSDPSEMAPVMKRSETDPQEIDSFVNKKVKATIEFTESNDEVKMPPIEMEPEDYIINPSDLPSCWTPDSAKHFKRKYPWMSMKDGKLGCTVCAEIKDGKSSHSENWIQCMVVANGCTKLTQQSSLRKKLFEHSKTARHIQMVRIIEGDIRAWVDNPPSNGTENEPQEADSNSEEIVVTARVFLAVYNLCQQNRPMVDIEGQIQMLKSMKVNMGHCLHSRFTAIRIVDHVGGQMKRKLFDKVIAEEAKITVIVEEALMKILQRPTFVVLFQTKLQTCAQPLQFFLDLFELENASTHELHAEIFNCLGKNGFDRQYLWRNMLSPVYTLTARTRDKYPDFLQTLPSGCEQSCMQAITIDSQECERLLSLLTAILTEERNRLNTEHISNMMTIKSIGKPITEWNPIPYVHTWVKKHRNAMDTRIKNHVEKPPTEYNKQMWSLID